MDFQKDSIHTAQQWQSYWEERVRPRYLKRKAKQTQRASPEKTVPVRSHIAMSPKRTVASPSSAFSPVAKDHSLMPELPQTTFSQTRDPKSPQRSRAVLSPVFKSNHSLMPESPEIGVRDARDPALPENSVVVSMSAFSPSVERQYALKPAVRSPSYHPESPTMIASSPSMHRKATKLLNEHMPSLPSHEERRTQITPEKFGLPNHEATKRKHIAIEEDLPSSSPLGPISPKRRRLSASELPLEIASTPKKFRERDNDGQSSPFINLVLEEDEPSLPKDSTEDNSPPGQELSDTLSVPGRVVNDTQAVFGEATQLIDFELAAPNGGWDNEELPDQNLSHAVSSDPPLPEYSREDNLHGNKESTPELVDFDVSPPEGGWDEEELQNKEEPELPNTEIYDSQPALPDTQAILRGKTPAPDFSIPDPDGGWTSLTASSSPRRPSSPRAESEFSATELQDQMEAWFEAHAVEGISVEQVESVLQSTSMDTTIAGKALRHLAKKGVLPNDWKGVWTESDDEDLKSTDARKIQRLQEKHGADCLKARWEYLDHVAD